MSKSQDCAPVNFSSKEINSAFYLKWNTKEECTGFVRYGSKKGDYSYLALDEKGVVKLNEHSVKLNGINKGDQYYFVIISNDKVYGLEDEAILLKF